MHDDKRFKVSSEQLGQMWTINKQVLQKENCKTKTSSLSGVVFLASYAKWCRAVTFGEMLLYISVMSRRKKNFGIQTMTEHIIVYTAIGWRIVRVLQAYRPEPTDFWRREKRGKLRLAMFRSIRKTRGGHQKKKRSLLKKIQRLTN